jgi:hypothetical protein
LAASRTRGRRVRTTAHAALVFLALGASGRQWLRAQDEGGPVFVLQPGVLTADFLSAPDPGSSSSGFNLRFMTRLPTRSRWLTPVVGGSLTPYGLSGVSDRNTTAPVLFAGNIFPLIAGRRPGDWLTAELPLLIQHSYGGGGVNNPRLFGRDLYVQFAVYLHLGRRVLGDLGATWRRLDVYGFLEQNLTPNEDGVTGRTDRFNPVAMFGVSLALGGAGR